MKKFKEFVNGDESALEELVNQYSASLLRYCYSILGNYSDAEDVTQIVFIKAYNKRNTIKDEHAIKAFLYKVAYRSCIDTIRKRKFMLVPALKDDELGAYYDDYDNDFPEELRMAFKKISPMDRAIVYERIINDVPYKELAQTYGKSESQLRKRYERARKKMSKLLENEPTFSNLGEELGGQNE